MKKNNQSCNQIHEDNKIANPVSIIMKTTKKPILSAYYEDNKIANPVSIIMKTKHVSIHYITKENYTLE